MVKNKKSGSASDEEILNLIEAFKYFDKTTTALNQAYRKLELKIDDLRTELEEKNRLLTGSVAEANRTKTFLALILENMSSGVIVIDHKGTITVFNKMAEEITGYESQEVINRHYEEIFGKDENHKSSLLNTLNTEEVVYKKEKNITTKSGEVKPLLFSTSVILDDKENILGAVEIFEDLTEIKQLQEEVNRHKTLVELGEMAASIAHEIRNPLGGIGGFATLLERDLEGEPEKQKLAQRIIKGINELHKFTSDVLMYTRKMEPNISRVNVKRVIQDTLSLIKIEAGEKGVEVKYDHPKEDIEIEIDVDLLKRMLLNLFKNAISAMPDGGRLSVTLSWQMMRNKFEILIADTGVGIDSENLEKIFNPFFTTYSQGTGLGLAMVRRMIEVHNGNISVKSEEGKGTEFLISLPILQKQDSGED